MPQQTRVGNHATTTFTENGVTKIVYHNTPVVSFSDKEIVLNTGGWKTSTTKTRMNQASSQFDLGFHVKQEKGYWIASYKGIEYHFIGHSITLPRG